MRTFFLITGTFALLVGVFVGYTMMQTGDTTLPPSYGDGGPIVLPGQRDVTIGRGEQAWVKIFNDRWEVASQFRAAEYDPRPDGRVHVIQPESIFFLSGGDLIRVRGREGVVVMSRLPEPEAGGSMAPSEPPSRGELIDVEIELFDSPEALEADSPDNDTSTLRVRLNNAAFDNETTRIYTEAAVIDGQEVPADQIPVTVRGRDYEFDGRGLTIRWNDRERRLELLRIEHGERLVINNPSRFTDGAFGPPRRDPDDGDAQQAALSWMLASTDDAAIAQAIPAPTTRPSRQPYRADFDRNVRVFQGEQQLVAADRMFIDFVFDNRQLESSPGEPLAPATKPATAAIPAADVLPSTQPSAPDQPESPDAPDQPLTVYWEGPLIVTAAPESAPRPEIGGGIIHLVGQPLRLYRNRGDIAAGSFVYDTGAQTLAIDAADDQPIVLGDGDGTVINTRSLIYSGQTQRAELRGASSATFPVRSDDLDTPQTLQATWTDRCILDLSEAGIDSLAIERARLVGAVRIEHPSVRLASQSLELSFDPASTTQPAAEGAELQLRNLAARGEVDCIILDADTQTEQRIQADRLEIATAIDDRGRSYPRQIQADGQRVRVSDGEQSLAARHLTATLRPADEDGDEPSNTPRIALQRLIAIDAAEYTKTDGQRAAADRIEVVMAGDQPTITLLGNATVSDGNNAVHGPHVQIVAADQVARIVGPGSLEGVTQSDPKAQPRPISVEWSQSAVVDGQANSVQVLGNVVATTSTPDGAAHAISGKTMTMTLADAPPDDATGDQREVDAAEAPQPLARKQVESVMFEQDVELRSLRNDKEGRLLRRFVLTAARLAYHPQRRRMVVPVPGRLLFEDHPQPAQAADDDANQLFGATAMKWEQQLTYDEIEQQITLEGDVLIVHEPDANQDQPPFRLNARTVIAELDRTSDSPSEVDQPERPDLRRLIAKDQVRFASRGIELEAARIEHDPRTGLIVATGTDHAPVQIHQGVTRGSFREARFNLRTEQLQVTDFRGNVRQ